jgi:natural product precursor
MKKLSFEKFNESIFKPLSVSEMNKIKGGTSTYTHTSNRNGDDNGRADTPSEDLSEAF